MSFDQLLRRHATAWPAKLAVVDDRVRLTYAELDGLVDRVATGLASHGIARGDAVACLLPNRAEAVVLFHAVQRLGAVWSPIVPIYGAREVRFILRQAESTALIVPSEFRGVDYAALVERVRPDVPSLRHVFTVDALSTLLEGAAPSAPGGRRGQHPNTAPTERRPPPESAGADAVAVILYTSGTTADPKGVLHSTQTLLAECRATVAYHRLAADEVLVMPSPLSHISGLLYGILLPAVLGATSVLMETWDPEAFCSIVERERGTFSAGATPFLQGVVDLPHLDRYDLRSLRLFPCGGADVPPELIRRALRRLGVRSGRGYGSTEFPSITSSAGPEVPDEKRAATDGAPIGPNQVELRDDNGRPVRVGREGEIWARGPELCLGYRDAGLDAEAFDERRFFRSGDLGVLDGDGYLTITGRVKDIIVRGGEKFSAKEVEDLLFEHPKVRSVAIVPMPDERLGERACAFVVPADAGDPPTLAELAHFLSAQELSRRKLPERLELVSELPVTASGKVQKHVLRERLRVDRRTT
jgi:cyclohexanecarboxylate-CoA ligase